MCSSDLALAAASLISLLAAWNHRRRILPGLEDVDRHSYGTVAYGASITLLLLLWWPRQPLPVAAGVLVMAFGDGLAGLLGRQLHSFSWTLLGQRRSLVGTASMAVVSLLVLLGLAQAAAAFAQPAPPIPALAVIGLIATLLEQLAIGGLDNLTVPLAVGWLWSLWSLA